MNVRKRVVIIAVSIAAGSLLLAGVAYATIPGSDGVIHACRDNGGIIKVINSDASCPNGWAPLDWNQTGPQGLQGIQGPQGEPGSTGPQGPAGRGATYTHEIVTMPVAWTFPGYLPDPPFMRVTVRCTAGTVVGASTYYWESDLNGGQGGWNDRSSYGWGPPETEPVGPTDDGGWAFSVSYVTYPDGWDYSHPLRVMTYRFSLVCAS